MPVPAAKATTLFTRTGARGKNALSSLASRGKDGAADALLAMRDDIATQRALVRAWSRDDLSTSELARTLNRYDSLDAGKQAEYRKLVLAGGDEVAAASARLSDDALETVLSADVSTGTRVRLMRAGRDVDGDQFESALADVDALPADAQVEAVEAMAATGEDGVEFVREADSETLGDFFGACRVGGSSSLSLQAGVQSTVIRSAVASGVQSGCLPEDLDTQLQQLIVREFRTGDIASQPSIDAVRLQNTLRRNTARISRQRATH